MAGDERDNVSFVACIGVMIEVWRAIRRVFDGDGAGVAVVHAASSHRGGDGGGAGPYACHRGGSAVVANGSHVSVAGSVGIAGCACYVMGSDG